MHRIKPSGVLFIKLGKKGHWEEDCLTNDQTLRLGFNQANYNDCRAGNWESVHNYYVSYYKKKGNSKPERDANSTVNAIRRFFEEDSKTLWITFYSNRMWWCFGERKVHLLEDGSKIRKVIGRWSSKDIFGNELRTERLSGKLLKTQGFRGTICNVEDSEYALNRINGERPRYVLDANRSLVKLERRLYPLFGKLTWQDFEILVDLVFRQAGWQRVGAVGKTTKLHDLDLIAPVTGERSLVQIKSSASRKIFESYCDKFDNMLGYDRFFFIVHSPKKDLARLDFHHEKIKLVRLKELSHLTVKSGLTEWLISKAS